MVRLLLFALALCVAGVAVFFYLGFEYEFLLAFAFLFSKRFVSRYLSKLLIIPVIYMLLPEAWRHKIDAWLLVYRNNVKRAFNACVSTWKWAPWWLRAIMAIVCAIVAGVTVVVCIFIPVPVKKFPFIGEAMRRQVIPYLMHQSALRGLDDQLPEIVTRIPRGIRDTARKYYMRLWWKTARKLVKTRQGLGRNMVRIKLEKESHRKPGQHMHRLMVP